MTFRGLMVDDAETKTESASWLWTIPCAEPHARERSLGRDEAVGLNVKFAGFLFDHALTAGAVGLAATASEARIVKAAYQHWGLELFSHLRGSFALAIADPAQHRTVVARDHLGLQPLFYASRPDRVIASPSAQLLARQPGVSNDLNRVALADALCHRFPSAEETYFNSIKRLPGACFLVLTPGALTIHRYWDPLARSSASAHTEEEAFDRYVALQHQAVQRCTSLGRSAVFLSGGLDSTGVAVAASHEGSTRQCMPLALSLTFPNTSCDERPIQTAVSTALGMPQYSLTFDEAVGKRSLLEQGLELNRDLSSPLLNYWRPAYMQLARLGRAKGARTVLSGEGGDEWMVTSPYVAADLIGRGRFLAARQFRQAWKRAEDGRALLWHAGFRPLAGRFFSALAPRAWDARRARRVASASPEWVAPDPEIRRAQRARAGQSLGPAAPPHGFAAAASERILRGAISHQILEESFVQGKLLGMTFAHPYHDPDLVEFFCRLPPHLSNAGGWIRGLSRRQLALRFPILGFERQRKRLANTFMADTLEHGRSQLTDRELEFPRLERLGLVDARLVRAHLHVPGRGVARRAWQLMNAEAWIAAQIDN